MELEEEMELARHLDIMCEEISAKEVINSLCYTWQEGVHLEGIVDMQEKTFDKRLSLNTHNHIIT